MTPKLTIATLLATLALSALSMPTALPSSLLPRAAEGEPFQCDDPSATSAGKQTLINAGAQQLDIAIAMLENGCAFTAAYAPGNSKSDDAAELGVYRNNWHMLRTYCDRFKGAGPGDWLGLGSQLHNDVGIATQCQRQLFDTLGADQYYALQRGGTGNPGAGSEYGQYVNKYNDFVAAHMTDGMAIYYNIPQI
ncbi:hypothetical protein G7Y79_00002g005490 [Physcia stellaris]|nr:hypothetical protein G7Y79_00002g005490 [Physcia stellaris]